MGWKYHVLLSADRIARSGFALRRRMPTYFGGRWISLCQPCWTSLYVRYEGYMTEALSGNLRHGDVFWDVGANVGLMSLLAAKLVGTGGSVVSFEPSPEVVALLRSNTSGQRVIETFQCGVGSTDGTVPFVAQGTSTSSSFIKEVTESTRDLNKGQEIRVVPVSMKRLDTLLDEHRPPTLVKIDTEGFELEVLKGGERLLAEIRPKLVIEIHPPQLQLSGGSEQALFDILAKHRYAWTVIDRNPNSLYTIVAKPDR